MSTSGSTDFVLNRDQLIKASLRLCRVIDSGEDVDATLVSDAAQTLNLLIKEWHSEGMPKWAVRSQSITLTASQASYTLGPTGGIVMKRPLEIAEAFIRDGSNNDTPLNMFSRQEYEDLGDKSATGTPHAIYYDAQLTNGVLYVYNPPTTTIASTHTIRIRYHAPYEDMDAAINDFDFPQEFLNAIKWGLARELIPELGVPERLARRIEINAEMKKNDAFGYAAESESAYFQPHP